MQCLGKYILLILIFFVTLVDAKVTAKLDPSIAQSGQIVHYNLIIEGNDIEQPQIDTLCGSEILSRSSSTSISMIGNTYNKTNTLTYSFMAEKSCTIDGIDVAVDGKMEHPNSVTLKVQAPSHDSSAPFIVDMHTDKSSYYVGEPFILSIDIKQKSDAQVVDSQFVQPNFKGFWIKEKYDPQTHQDGDRVVTTLRYKIAPQREGNITIQPAQIRIATRVHTQDMWGSFMPQIQWRAYISNSLDLTIKPLPNNAHLIGDFTIETDVDKTTIHPNEAVNVTIKVHGDGNLEDIESFKPYIHGVNVFDEKIKIQGDTLTQKLAFVSDGNFTIPPFHLDFYNTQTQKVQRIATKPIDITVIGGVQKKQEQLHIQKSTPSLSDDTAVASTAKTQISYSILGAVFVFGIIIGGVLVYFKPKLFVRKEQEKKLNLKDEKILLIKLMEFKDQDPQVLDLVEKLEQNIYHGKKIKIDKKVLKSVLKKYKLS